MSKVDMPDVVTFLLIGQPIFEWYLGKSGSKNGYQKDTYLKDIGLHAPNMTTSVGSIAHIIRDSYMTIQWAQFFCFDNENRTFIQAMKWLQKVVTSSILDLLIILC